MGVLLTGFFLVLPPLLGLAPPGPPALAGVAMPSGLAKGVATGGGGEIALGLAGRGSAGAGSLGSGWTVVPGIICRKMRKIQETWHVRRYKKHGMT